MRLLFLFGILLTLNLTLISHALTCSDLVTLATGRSSKYAKWVEYSNGARALLLGRVGKTRGGSANIWKALLYSNEHPQGVLVALRLPKDKESVIYLEHTVRGYEKLSKTDITIPKLISFSLTEYVAMEFIPHRFTLDEYFNNPERFSSKTQKFLADKFLEFARTTYQWETIPDFHPFQIVYDHVRERWVYLDWAYPEHMVLHRKTSTSRRTLFGEQKKSEYQFLDDRYGERLEDLTDKAHEAVMDERNRLKQQ